MKIKLFFAISLAILLLAGCSETESDEFCENSSEICPVDNSTIQATACCTDQDCYWVYENNNYNSVDALLNVACPAPSAYFDLNKDLSNADIENLRARLQAVTSELMIQARQAAACEY